MHVSTIATKTGTITYAGSPIRVLVEICDSQGTCCQTDGLNRKKDREIGQTDVYTNTAILGNCTQEVIHILTLVDMGEETRSCFEIIYFCAFNK